MVSVKCKGGQLFSDPGDEGNEQQGNATWCHSRQNFVYNRATKRKTVINAQAILIVCSYGWLKRRFLLGSKSMLIVLSTFNWTSYIFRHATNQLHFSAFELLIAYMGQIIWTPTFSLVSYRLSPWLLILGLEAASSLRHFIFAGKVDGNRPTHSDFLGYYPSRLLPAIQKVIVAHIPCV